MKLSITRILAELKLNESKIETALSKKKVGLYQKKSTFVLGTGDTPDEFEKSAKANFQSLCDLITRAEKLRTALTRANAENKITVAGKEMSLSEAISYKDRVIPVLEQVLRHLRNEYSSCVNQSENHRAQIDEGVQEMLEKNLGKDRKADSNAYDAIAKPFIEANELRILDPAGIKNYIDFLEKEITDFKSEIDICLSEANAKFEIEIDV